MPREDSIGALWIKEGRNGKYMSGVVEIDGVKANVVVFKNNYKTEDRHPDYRILKSKPREAGPTAPAPSDNEFEDDIPF